MFLAALDLCSATRKYSQCIEQALRPTLLLIDSAHEQRDGTAAYQILQEATMQHVVYGLVRLSTLTARTTLSSAASALADLLDVDSLEKLSNPDLLGGVAGALIDLCVLYEHTRSAAVLTKARRLARRLVDDRVESRGYRAWLSPLGDRPLTGLSHGASGICHGLLRLCRSCDEREFRDAAMEALEYERSVDLPDAGQWPDFWTNDPSGVHVLAMTSWCAGAPGIGLARLAAREDVGSEALRADLDLAIGATQRFGLRGLDNICCGNMGRIGFLHRAADALSHRDLADTAMSWVSAVLERAQRAGYRCYDHHPVCDVPDPGFFRRLAGIGYELLRMSEAHPLPDVLVFEQVRRSCSSLPVAHDHRGPTANREPNGL